ncbi:DUF1801 domain-containing protein [Microbacteriaceae bacterium VKM Ac-2854]|nr:DUF1801 domain-containing protein [Microbacteriaceae bacterium VKM Ac-2854]
MSDEAKTKPTSADIDAFVSALPPTRAADARSLIAEMTAITGEPPVLWGPSIIGFGSYHYVYETGREGDAVVLGFAPKGAKISIYLADGVDRHQAELAALGAHSVGKGCLYLNRLATVDLEVLRRILQQSYAHTLQAYPRG